LGLALIRSQWGYAYIASSMIGLLTGAILMDISMLSVATPIAIVRSAEIFLSWMMLKGVVSQHKNLGHPAVLLRFVLTAVAGGPLLSGIVASTMMHWEAGVSWAGFLLNWWSSSALGMAVFAPMVVNFRPEALKKSLQYDQVKQAILPWLCLVLVAFLVFTQHDYPFTFMTFAPLMWLVFRWGFPGAALGGTTLLLITMPLTFFGFGPIAHMVDQNTQTSMFVLQVYIATGLLIVYPVGMILDHRNRLILRLKQREQDLLHASLHDPLTDLLNRRGFAQKMEEELDKAKNNQGSVSAVVFDVDYFKKYNDTYGHGVGDECLIWIAQTLKQEALKIGAVPSRQGGEEFGVLLPQKTAIEAIVWAEKLAATIFKGQREHKGSPLGFVSISAGVATRTAQGRNTDTKTLLQEADVALYEAKHQGRNRVCLWPDGQRKI